MRQGKIMKFFRGGAFTEENRTFKPKSGKVFSYIVFNRSILVVKENETENPYLMRMVSFRNVTNLTVFKNGDVFIGTKTGC